MSEPVPEDEPRSEEETYEGGAERSGILGRTVGAILGVGAGRPGEGEEGEEPEEKEPEGKPESEVLDLDAEEEGEEEAEEEEAEEEEAEEEEEEEEEPEDPVAPAPAEAGSRLNLNRATFEQLRDIGFSVTQATRVITYRERQDGFESVDDLADVPGMPGEFLGDVKGKLTL
jgi:competence ComEA-like helix-hairpin-helix protein